MRFLLALVAFGAGTAFASGLDDFLAFNTATRTATARFEQQVLDRSGKVVERAAGTFAFARPGKFRWTYEKPNKQLLVGDGQKLWIYDPDLAQVTVKRIDQAISSTPAALLAGKDDITRLFTLKDAGNADGLNWVEALPKAQDTGFERVRLGLNGKSLAAMELYDQLGGRTMLRFGPQGERHRRPRHVHVHAAQGRRRAGRRSRPEEEVTFPDEPARRPVRRER